MDSEINRMSGLYEKELKLDAVMELIDSLKDINVDGIDPYEKEWIHMSFQQDCKCSIENCVVEDNVCVKNPHNATEYLKSIAEIENGYIKTLPVL